MDNKLVVLENQYLRTKISPVVGGSIFSFQYNLDSNWVDVMRPTPQAALDNNEPGNFSSFTMLPYSNRIENGVLNFLGQAYQLEINHPSNHAIHGDVRTRTWKIKEQTNTKLVLTFDSQDYPDISWPFPFIAQADFGLEDTKFITKLSILNNSDQEMPAGFGIHPYFVRQLTAADDQVLVELPTKGIYPDQEQIPTGPWQAVPEELDFSQEKELTTKFIDKCYRSGNNSAYIKWVKSGVKLDFLWDDIYQHLILYCPKDDQRYFAIEPVTNCNNGFNMAEKGISDTGTVYLQAGQKLAGKIELKISRI